MSSHVLIIGSEESKITNLLKQTLADKGISTSIIQEENNEIQEDLADFSAILAIVHDGEILHTVLDQDQIPVFVLAKDQEEIASQKDWVLNGKAPTAFIPYRNSDGLLHTIRPLIQSLNDASKSFSQEEVSEFIHFLRHDLNNAMHNVLGYISLLEDEYDPDLLERIDNLIKKTSKLLDDYVKRADQGNLKPKSS